MSPGWVELLPTGDISIKSHPDVTVREESAILQSDPLLSVVSCLRSDLESIAANNQQIELSTPISSLHYGTTYRFECKTFGQEFQLEDGSFQYHAEVTCQEDKTWTAVTDQCQCEIQLKTDH